LPFFPVRKCTGLWAASWAALVIGGCAHGSDSGDDSLPAPFDASGSRDDATGDAGEGPDARPSESGANDAAPVDDATPPDVITTDAPTVEGGGSDAGIDGGGAADTGSIDTGPDAAGSDARSDGPTASDAAPEGGPSCTGDLSNIGTGDFRIAFSLSSTLASSAAILNQRSVCGHGVFWDVRLGGTNGSAIRVETDDGTNYTDLNSVGTAVNDGKTHNVVVTRVAGTLAIAIDGAASGSSASNSALGQLALLVTGTDVCVGQLGCVAFAGTLSNVCVGR
jgi:hypothetical protein